MIWGLYTDTSSKALSENIFCNQLIINDKAVNLADVQSLINSPYKNIKEKKHFETMDCLIFGDFVKLRFQCGDPIPYNPEMYDIQSDKNIKNTREKSQVEPNLYFGVIDLRKGWVWLPYRAKAIFKEAVRSVHPNFVLKSIKSESLEKPYCLSNFICMFSIDGRF